MLLGKSREDEVFVGHRQEPELRLGALGNSLPESPARSNGDLGLDQLVAGALRIAVRIEKADQARFLIIPQKLVTDREHDYREYRNYSHILPTQSGQERTRNQNGQVGEGGTEVRLFEYEKRRYCNQSR